MPANRLRCCVGTCNDYVALYYLKNYPICNKHWDLDCEYKFKYKHFKTLREFLGFPPIEKPKGHEHLDEECFAYHAEIQIDVETNAPIIISEKLSLWHSDTPPTRPPQANVKWNGKKEDPLELFMTINGTDVILLKATGIAVKFSSEKAIYAAMTKVQRAVVSGISTLGLKIGITFK